MPKWRDDPSRVRPMLATLADAPLVSDRLLYEPKYDGIRALVGVTARGVVRIWSRLGNEKTAQFPDIAREVSRIAGRRRRDVLLDGEIVALDDRGEPAGFQALQDRMHLTREREIASKAEDRPAALMLFDILRDGDDDLRPLSLLERRARLERLLGRSATHRVRLSRVVRADGRELQHEAEQRGWEGLIAKDVASSYESGRRSPAWRKLKLVKRQEFVVGGWTEPRQSRQHLGALLLGTYDPSSRKLTYVGHTGTGFDQKELTRLSKILAPLETRECPFVSRPKTNEPPHWVRPELVAEVKFTEWTADNRLRHPVYLGLRDDKKVSEVVREYGQERPTSGASVRQVAAVGLHDTLRKVLSQLEALEDARRNGGLELPGGGRLEVTNLHKVFWPDQKITKGELLRYYTRISTLILPAVADRPLVLKRFPNGIRHQAFYQQQVKPVPPAGVRVVRLPDDEDPIGEPDAQRYVGGSLTTLLYLAQLGAISQDPWFSRVQSIVYADHVAIDLDPSEGVRFAQVVDVARWTRDELERLGIPSFPKTSGSRGLHVYIPLRPKTTYETGLLLCQIVATIVASKHPTLATVERTVSRRGRTVYVDYLQNILGKTLATAYSARATEFAGVSTPLTWAEVDERLDPQAFTIRTVFDRFDRRGDVWAGLRESKGADLRGLLEGGNRGPRTSRGRVQPARP